MGSGLEPVLGLLRYVLKILCDPSPDIAFRVTRSLLRLADKPFSEILERSSPLPFFALSNLLTLFSHDMPTLSLIQHVFDYLLCRPPIAVVYLAAVVCATLDFCLCLFLTANLSGNLITKARSVGSRAGRRRRHGA
jgi:TBC1 domain family member 20